MPVSPASARLARELAREVIGLPEDARIALIVTELVTNAFKYAYPAEGAGGRVRVAVVVRDNGEIAITVKDEGVGLPDGFSVAGGTNLGMILIASLLAQLSGRIEIQDHGPGTCFLVTVPIDDRG